MTIRVPLLARIGLLVLGTTAFYTYVGQMVPQKEVHPPTEVQLKADMTTPELIKAGREIMDNKGLCFTCHTIGKKGPLRFPDLENVGVTAKTRIQGMTDVEYFAQSMYEPDAFIVKGFNPGMPVINKAPIGLSDQEILCVIAYLQNLGGTPTVTLQSTHRYRGAAPGTPAAAVTPEAVPTPGQPPTTPATTPAGASKP